MAEISRRNRTVAAKVEEAKRGDMGCKFEVSKWLKEGKYSLDVDIEKSKEYLEEIKTSLQEYRLYFSTLDLSGYKGIKGIKGKISLDPHLNVFVGVNGSGKTTIIEAFKRASTWLVNGIKSNSNGRSIGLDEINKDPNVYEAFLKSSISFNDDISSFELLLHKSRKASVSSSSELAEFKNLAAMYSYYNEIDEMEINLPIFAHYSVSRALEIKREDCKRENKEFVKPNKLNAYESPFEESRNFKELLEWLAYYDENTPKKGKYLEELTEKKAEYKTLNDLLNSLPKDLDSNIDFFKDVKKKVDDLQIIIKEIEHKSDLDVAVVKTVKHAIYKFMDISNIRMNITEENISVVLDKNGITISAFDLSHGEKALFSLVSDITRRLVLLNPKAGTNPLEGFGVITIDEIDLHLHPQWQQEVVQNLIEVFPNVQFILTTHSPQVLSTIPSQCIKVINSDSNGLINISEPKFSLGFEPNMILEGIFLTEPRPSNVQQVKDLEEYKKLIKKDLWDSERAIELEKKLDNWAKDYDPIMRQLKMDIRLRKRRRSQ